MIRWSSDGAHTASCASSESSRRCSRRLPPHAPLACLSSPTLLFRATLILEECPRSCLSGDGCLSSPPLVYLDEFDGSLALPVHLFPRATRAYCLFS